MVSSQDFNNCRLYRGEVVTSCPDDLRGAVNNSDEFQWIVYDMGLMPEQIKTKEQVCALRAAWMMYQDLSAVRQLSAPVVAVPSAGLLEKWAHNGEYTELDKEAEAFASNFTSIPNAAARGYYVGWKLALATTKQAPDVGAYDALKKELDVLQRKAFDEFVTMANKYREALERIAKTGGWSPAQAIAMEALEPTTTANPQQNDAQTGVEDK